MSGNCYDDILKSAPQFVMSRKSSLISEETNGTIVKVIDGVICISTLIATLAAAAGTIFNTAGSQE